ncbi:hypothetical protein [uncultured Tateyamaria sp.]|uniref:hypothetical protein n=1 Tax=uncultured Tateyamaria sp. TaxID=455651 RepID=UPI0026174D9A|nr:hypothetical protein [uncultured Tateyamaria sp.]
MGNTPPTDTLRDGNIKASIWENTGEKGPFFTTTFSKTYRDAEGKVRDTNGFNKGDLLRLAELARASYSRTGQLQREVGQNGPSREERMEELAARQNAQRNDRDQQAHRDR